MIAAAELLLPATSCEIRALMALSFGPNTRVTVRTDERGNSFLRLSVMSPHVKKVRPVKKKVAK